MPMAALLAINGSTDIYPSSSPPQHCSWPLPPLIADIFPVDPCALLQLLKPHKPLIHYEFIPISVNLPRNRIVMLGAPR